MWIYMDICNGSVKIVGSCDSNTSYRNLNPQQPSPNKKCAISPPKLNETDYLHFSKLLERRYVTSLCCFIAGLSVSPSPINHRRMITEKRNYVGNLKNCFISWRESRIGIPLSRSPGRIISSRRRRLDLRFRSRERRRWGRSEIGRNSRVEGGWYETGAAERNRSRPHNGNIWMRARSWPNDVDRFSERRKSVFKMSLCRANFFGSFQNEFEG